MVNLSRAYITYSLPLFIVYILDQNGKCLYFLDKILRDEICHVPLLLFISKTIHHCQPCHSISIYIGYMASHHPFFNFYLIQWSIHNRSRDPSYQPFKPRMSWNRYLLYSDQVWRRFVESLKSYGCFQILWKLGCAPCLNMLEIHSYANYLARIVLGTEVKLIR